MLHIQLQPEDLAALRFAYSPLIELSISYQSLRYPKSKSTLAQWKDEANQALTGFTFPFLDAVASSSHYIADFITPTPLSPIRSLEKALANLQETPEEIIHDNVLHLAEKYGLTPERQYFIEHPREALFCLIDELRLYWQLTLERYWPQMRSILENDILYRARQYALDGTDTLIRGLASYLEYQTGELRINSWGHKFEEYDYEMTLPGTGIQFVPTLFCSADLMWQIQPEWQPMLVYTARGGGLWQKPTPPPTEALSVLLGEGRTRVLETLLEPLSTSELAQRLDVTAGAVSQHLGRLNQAGLVESHRSGNRVYYRLSHRGTQLLELFT